MNQTELILRVRRNAFIPTGHPTYTDQVILDELNDALRSIYEDTITIPRQGHWLKQYMFSSAVGQSSVRINPRAVVGGVEKVEIGVLNGPLLALDQVGENHAQIYESFGGRTDVPQYYAIRGDNIEFLPTFNSIMTVRISYYLKPNLIVTPQSIPATMGRVTAKSLSGSDLRVDYVNSSNFPVIKTGLNAGSTPVSGTVWDIIHSNGTLEVALVDLIVSAAGATFTTFLPGNWDANDLLNTIQIGDFVRGAGETDWPPLPEEFHRTVADTAAIKILLQLNNAPKAQALAQSVGGDLQRLQKLIEAPRTRRQPKRVGARLMTRGGNFGMRGWGRW